ncbi:MAG: PepSY domain-containing protein [Kangiellaceae bacterium]|nr:PepSY domain-containing protein [Kangiellaceae bacterium]
MKPIVFFRKFHKWLGLIIGLQLLLWTMGGVVMSFFDIEKVRGEVNIAKQQVINLEQPINISAQELLQRLDFVPTSIELKGWMGNLVWAAKSKQHYQLVDAQTGEMITPLNEDQARQVAEADFAGKGEIAQVVLLDEEGIKEFGEVRGRKAPLWQMQFNDEDNTRIYVSAEKGSLVARRNDTWRFYDFFWMLHIMDYKERSDFNHPLLIIAALLALFMSLSGLYLVIKLVIFKPKRAKING